MNKLIRIVAPMLIVSILLMSCAASEHAGISYKKRPPLTETNEEVWFAYWEDQLDANRGRVISPPLEYPEVAKSAYSRAAENWNLKVNEARSQTYIAWGAGSLGLVVLIYVLALSKTPSTSTYPY